MDNLKQSLKNPSTKSLQILKDKLSRDGIPADILDVYSKYRQDQLNKVQFNQYLLYRDIKLSNKKKIDNEIVSKILQLTKPEMLHTLA